MRFINFEVRIEELDTSPCRIERRKMDTTDMTMIAPYAFHNDYHAAYHRAANTTFTVASPHQKN